MPGPPHHVCPVAIAGLLDHRLRRWLHNPRKILGPFIRAGMTVLDIGCGPGVFTLDMAHLVGPTGRVIAADLQPGMLERIREKINGSELAARIQLHQCPADRLEIPGTVDFAIAFYMVHELPDPETFFNEVGAHLAPKGRLLLAEPCFHVSKPAFAATLAVARQAGFVVEERPAILFSRSAILVKNPYSGPAAIAPEPVREG